MTLNLISPDDGSLLTENENVLCDQSGNKYKKYKGKWNLSPNHPIKVTVDFELIDHNYFRNFKFTPGITLLYPENKSDKIKEEILVGLLKKESGKNFFLLDHGCGSGAFRDMVESYGYNYIGIDNDVGTSSEQIGGKEFSGGADYYCDLHKLPFEGNKFDFIISNGVFEHLQNPFIAANELFRVMKPGALGLISIGTLVPFHMDSFFHHTHFGTLNTFKSAGFEVVEVSPSTWNGFQAIASMDGIPGPRFIRLFFSSLIYKVHRWMWKIRAKIQKRDPEKDDLMRALIMTGVTKTVIRKPA